MPPFLEAARRAKSWKARPWRNGA